MHSASLPSVLHAPKSHPLWSDHPSNVWWRVQVTKLPIMQSILYFVTRRPYQKKSTLQILLSYTFHVTCQYYEWEAVLWNFLYQLHVKQELTVIHFRCDLKLSWPNNFCCGLHHSDAKLHRNQWSGLTDELGRDRASSLCVHIMKIRVKNTLKKSRRPSSRVKHWEVGVQTVTALSVIYNFILLILWRISWSNQSGRWVRQVARMWEKNS
jgi:hypothetical protein